MVRLGIESAQLRVDHAVERPVLRWREPGKQPRVTKRDMVQFVQHQHHEVVIGGAEFGNERGVEQQPRATTQGHGGSGHRIGHFDVEQLQAGARTPTALPERPSRYARRARRYRNGRSWCPPGCGCRCPQVEYPILHRSPDDRIGIAQEQRATPASQDRQRPAQTSQNGAPHLPRWEE